MIFQSKAKMTQQIYAVILQNHEILFYGKARAYDLHFKYIH